MALFINKWECIFLPVAKTSRELCPATSPGVKDLFFINSIINLILGTQLCRGRHVCAGHSPGSGVFHTAQGACRIAPGDRDLGGG